MGEEKLQPCPFCGNDMTIVSIKLPIDHDIAHNNAPDDGTFFAWCIPCGARSGYRKTRQEAIDSWNVRFNKPLHEDGYR